MFFLILKQTIQLAFRKGGVAFGTLAFYIIIVTLFTFGLGPEAMRQFAGPVMCVSLLLATVTTLPLYYERDHEDGSLEQYLLSPGLLEWIVLARICGQWISSIVPMLIVSPLLALMSGLDQATMTQVMGQLLLASPTVAAIGSLTAALTLGSRRGGLLQALIALPLYMPVLIFAANSGGGWFLAAFMCASLPLSCYVSAMLIKLSQD